MHKSRHSETLKKRPWRVSFQCSHRLKAYNSRKNKPSKRHFSQSLLKREKGRLYRTFFIDTSDRDIILKQKLKNISVELENKK